MEKPDYKTTLERARMLLAAELKKREQAEIAIARLKRVIAGLANLTNDTSDTEDGDTTLEVASRGLKSGIRTALRASRKPITQTQLLEMLKEFNFPIAKHRKPLASIHTTLKRLLDDGEVGLGPKMNGRKTYIWEGAKYGAPGSLRNMIEDHVKDSKSRVRKQ